MALNHTNSTPAHAHRPMAYGSLKAGLFVIEGLNSMSTTWFFYYVYFLMQELHGFGAVQNFTLAAVAGLIYGIVAVFTGRFAQRFGYLVALRLGTLILIACFMAASFTSWVPLLVALVLIGNIGMCFTWPALEALVSEGESPARLPGLVGTYNVVWAVTAAVAYFTGGALIHALGWRGMFWIPAAMQMVELGLAQWVASHASLQAVPAGDSPPVKTVPHETIQSPVPPKTFLKMALLGNPFAYLSINTVVAVIPTLSKKLELTPMLAGFACSVWMFARAAAFVGLWLWPKWHYRFRFLAVAFAAMGLSFTAILLAPSLWVLLVAEMVFGATAGLMYYSSLFYAMDVGEAKGEHGGIHEAAIGMGCFAGPAMAAGAMRFFPESPNAGAWAVTFLLLCGLAGLFKLRYSKRPNL